MTTKTVTKADVLAAARKRWPNAWEVQVFETLRGWEVCTLKFARSNGWHLAAEADTAPGGIVAANYWEAASSGLQERCAYVAEILHGLWGRAGSLIDPTVEAAPAASAFSHQINT